MGAPAGYPRRFHTPDPRVSRSQTRQNVDYKPISSRTLARARSPSLTQTFTSTSPATPQAAKQTSHNPRSASRRAAGKLYG